MRAELQEWLRFLRAESNVLHQGSSRLFQLAMNQPDSSAPARAAKGRFAAGRETRPWFRWINKPTRAEPEILQLSGHVGHVLRCAYAADKHQLVSLSQALRHYADESDDNQPTELIWWNAATGAIISTLPLDVERITASAFTSDARLLALAVSPYRQLSKNPRFSDPSIPRLIKLIDTATGSLIAVLPGCEKQINSCSFSAACNRLIAGGLDGTVRVWDVNTHQQLLTIPAHEGTIRACAFSPSGSLIVTADSVDLKFWDANNGEHLRTLDHKSVTDCAFLSDERLAVTSNELSLIDVNTGETLFSEGAGGKGSIGVLGISPDAPVMVTGRGGYNLRLWQADVLADIGGLRGHEGAITSVAFLEPGSRQIASSADDGTIRVWELPRTNEVATFDKHREFVRKVTFLGDTNRIVSGGDDECVRIWEGDAAQELFTIPVGEHGISALACSSDSRHVAVGGWWYADGAQQGFLAVWQIEGSAARKVAEVNAGCVSCFYSPDTKFLAAIQELSHVVTVYTGLRLEEVAKLSEDGWKPKACSFSPDGELLIVAGDDLVNQLELRFFRTNSWEELSRLKTGQWRATDCALSPDGTLIAATSKSSGLATIELRTGKVTTLHGGSLTSVAFSPDGRRLVCGTEDKTLVIRDLDDDKKVGILAGHSALVSDCDWSQDGEQIVSCSQDGSVKLWDPAMVAESSGAPEVRGSVSACRYSPDNRFVLTMGKADSALKLWNRANGVLVSELAGRVNPHLFVYAFDVGYALAGYDDGELALFTREGQVVRKLAGDRTAISSFALSPQGERLAVTAGWFTPLKLYDARTLAQLGVIDCRQQDEIFGRCSFSPDGGILIAGTDQRLLFLNAHSTQPRYQIGNDGSSYGRGAERSWAVSPDGGLIALVRKRIDDVSATLRIIALGSEREILSFDIEDREVTRCSFSLDGRFFAIAAPRLGLRIRDVRLGTEVAAVTEENLSDFQYSADGTRAYVSAGDRICVFDSSTFMPEAEFVVNQSISSFAVAVDGSIAIGGVRGNMLFLDALGLFPGPPVMTGVCFYNFAARKWSKEPAVRCAWCGIVVRVTEVVVEAILEIGRQANLAAADVPSLSLPDEAWSDPRLLSDCIACRKPLKFNPFLNDFRNRLPQPAGGPAGMLRKLWRRS